LVVPDAEKQTPDVIHPESANKRPTLVKAPRLNAQSLD
jgi:hypothetical protein